MVALDQRVNIDQEEVNRKFDEKIFDATIDTILEEEHLDGGGENREKFESATFSEFITPLSTSLHQEWGVTKGNRRPTERRWLSDLRQYRGIYDPEILNKMHPKRSKAFIKLTRSKVRTVDARLMDLQFPANGEKNWSILPTPVPEIGPEEKEKLAISYFNELRKVPTDEDMRRVIMEAARERANNMEKEIEDQLVEFKYRDVIRNVVHSGNLYGTGIMKGPVVKEKSTKRWVKTGAEWKLKTEKKIIPIATHVPVWDCYPDLSARSPSELTFIFERHLMSKGKLLKLAKRSDFNRRAILAYMDAYPDGDAEHTEYENLMREMDSNNAAKYPESSIPKVKKFELVEYWGLMEKSKVEEELGLELREEDGFDDPEVVINCWLLGSMQIKLVVSPVMGARFPYFFYYFDKDETHFFGDGLPYIMRDPQGLLNASVRAMVDNAAISAGPIIEANIDLLADGEDPNDIYPFRSFQRTGIGTDGSTQAVRVTKLPSYTNQFMQMVEYFQAAADESTNIPRAMHGDGAAGQGVGAAGRTATGLSMLMGSANITLKDQLKTLDDFITKPFIKAIYFWNMEFNPKESIKGDFSINARGSASLVAKEVRLESLNQFLAIIANDPNAQMILDQRTLYNEYLKILDLDDVGLLKSKDEVDLAMKNQQKQEEAAADAARQSELLKAQSSGHVPGAAQGSVIVDPQGRPAMSGVDQSKLQEGQIPEIGQAGFNLA
jgi:hypothetical protein